MHSFPKRPKIEKKETTRLKLLRSNRLCLELEIQMACPSASLLPIPPNWKALQQYISCRISPADLLLIAIFSMYARERDGRQSNERI